MGSRFGPIWFYIIFICSNLVKFPLLYCSTELGSSFQEIKISDGIYKALRLLRETTSTFLQMKIFRIENASFFVLVQPLLFCSESIPVFNRIKKSMHINLVGV